MTVILLIAIAFYATLQSIKLLTFDETDVMVSWRDAYFDYNYTYSRGLAYAFALTAYDGNSEPIEDPSFGVLRPYYRSWGLKDLDHIGVELDSIPERACSKAELHINDDGVVDD